MKSPVIDDGWMIKQFYILFKVFQSYQSNGRTDVNNFLLIKFGNNLVYSRTQPCNPVMRVGSGNFSAKQMHLASANVMCTDSWGIIRTSVNFLNIRIPQKNCFNHSKIWTMWLYHRVMSPNDADGMANCRSWSNCSLIWVCTVCPDLSVRKITVSDAHHAKTYLRSCANR